jgi:hypothetical protein
MYYNKCQYHKQLKNVIEYGVAELVGKSKLIDLQD